MQAWQRPAGYPLPNAPLPRRTAASRDGQSASAGGAPSSAGRVHGAQLGAPPFRPQPAPATYHQWPGPAHHHQPQPGNVGAATRFAAYGPPALERRKRFRLLYVGALTALVVAVGLITGFAAPGFLVTRELDVTKAQAQVAHILSDPAGYGARNVSDVACNDGRNPTITKGATFTCEATIDHIRQLFVVTFTDDEGSYSVSQPTTGAAAQQAAPTREIRWHRPPRRQLLTPVAYRAQLATREARAKHTYEKIGARVVVAA
jgi:hypothetical protein